jgi:TRAP-type C4-dicarboxylate transport system permease small subunit
MLSALPKYLDALMVKFNAMKHGGKVIWHGLCVAEDGLRIVSIVAMTILVFIAIMLRLVMNWASPAWDEIARYIMIWSIMAGAIVTSREDEHIKMGFLTNILRTEKQLLVHDFIISVITLLFLCFFAVWSYNYLVFSLERGLRSIVTNIPMAPVHASFFIGAAFSILHFAVHVIKKGQRLWNYLEIEA